MEKIFHHSRFGLLSLPLVILTVSCSLIEPPITPPTAQTELLLFVQTARSGTLTPVNPSEGVYRLTLQNISPKVLYFSDKPYRDSGSMSVEDYLSEIFDPFLSNPNGALVIDQGNNAGQLTIALELSEPSYTPSASTQSYLVRQLTDVTEGLSHLKFDQLEALPMQFGSAELFIDSGDWHRCNVEFGNYTDIVLTLDSFALDPPHDSTFWNPEPATNIEQFGGSNFTFRFHAHDDERDATYTYQWGDGANDKVRFNFGCSTTVYDQTAHVTQNECTIASSEYTCSVDHKDNNITHRFDVIAIR